MTVTSRGDGEWTALVDDAMRPLIAEALAVEASASLQALEYATDERDRDCLRARLALTRDLLDWLGSTVGPVRLSAPSEFVGELLRDAASQAADALDTQLDAIQEDPAPLSTASAEELQARVSAIVSVTQALIAAEAHRRDGPRRG